MKAKRNALFLFIIFFWIARGNAQDVVYSQFYANPLYLNPALAGGKLTQRVTLNYRNQWPAIVKGYVSYNATWDQQFDKLSGGLGIIVNTDEGSGGLYNRFSASGIYSYRLRATRDLIFNAAIQAGYISYRLDWNKKIFGDQIDIRTGNIEPTREALPPKLTIGTVDFSAGLLAGYKESAYLGLTVNHLTRPDMSFYTDNSNRLKMRWTIHSGVMIDFFQGMEGEDIKNFSISPNIVYVHQGNFDQLNLGMYLNTYPFVAGLWIRHDFRNPDAAIVLLGFQERNYKIGYSFDYTISRLTIKSAGAHEISVAFYLRKYLDRDRYHEIRNPGF